MLSSNSNLGVHVDARPPNPRISQSPLIRIPLADLDAIIILAGGQTREGGLPLWVTRRLDLGAELQRGSDVPIVCLGGGTPHKPPILDSRGYVVHESTSCADYLIQLGVTPATILKARIRLLHAGERKNPEPEWALELNLPVLLPH